jgi:carbonic anhydrase
LLVVLGHESCGAVTAAVQGGETEGHQGKLKIVGESIRSKRER